MEIWKDIKGYEGIYQISTFGRVKSLNRVQYFNHPVTGTRHIKKSKEFIMNNSVCKGYNFIRLSKDSVIKSYRLCRLVAINFIPNLENKPQVNHIDGNKKNDNLNNLEWVTKSENMIHASQNGLLNTTNRKRTKVLCKTNNITYSSIKEYAKFKGVDNSTISRALSNGNKKYNIEYA
jgi:hypothetical protein